MLLSPQAGHTVADVMGVPDPLSEVDTITRLLQQEASGLGLSSVVSDDVQAVNSSANQLRQHLRVLATPTRPSSLNDDES